MTARPRRSCLYMPGANAKALEKAKTLAADVLLLDVEDSVAPEAKADARAAVAAAVKAKGYGRIINFVSSAGFRGEPGLGDYNATKEGIRALTKTAAREWGREGITVNCIAPGALSKRGQEFMKRDPEEFERRNAQKATPRLGDPEEDIAPVALFLASEESRFVTGQTMFADGGYCLL